MHAREEQSFEVPDPKEPMSLRVLGSTKRALAQLAKAWKAQARAEGHETGLAYINTSFVANTLLARACAEELEKLKPQKG